MRGVRGGGGFRAASGSAAGQFHGNSAADQLHDAEAGPADQDDLDISCTHNTHYYQGAQKIKREKIKPGDRVAVETKLDLYLKPEAVNVRVLPAE